MGGKKFKNFKNFLRERDLFGHDIKLNFHQDGTSHNTFVGGWVSVFVKLLYFFYMAFLFM